MKHVDHDKLLQSLDKSIKRYIVEYGEDDPSTKAMIKQDKRDLNEIKTLMKAGRYKQAFMKASYLDTMVRESIPDDVWDALQSSMEWQ